MTSNGRCGWSPVTLGAASELVTLKGGFQTLTGSRPSKCGHGLSGFGACAWCTACWRHQGTAPRNRPFWSGVASQSCLENCLERCTGRGGRLGVQHMLGGLVRGDVTVRRAAREATQGEVARRGFECTSDAAQTRGEKWPGSGGTRRRCTNVHCLWMRHLMKLM